MQGEDTDGEGHGQAGAVAHAASGREAGEQEAGEQVHPAVGPPHACVIHTAAPHPPERCPAAAAMRQASSP